MLFEDVSVGQVLPEVRTPPVSFAHLVRWAGAVENWHRIHYDPAFATQHEGLPDVVVPGTWKQQLLFRLVKDFAGPDGWVAEMEYQFRGIDTPGSVLVASGCVIRTVSERDYGVAECEIQLANPEGRVSAVGTARVLLPLRSGPPAPLP